MKLLSMRTESGDRAGLVLGDEALDVTEYLEARGIRRESKLADALDLYSRGVGWLNEVTSSLEGDANLKDECRQKGALKPLSEITLNPPVLAPGKMLAVGLNYMAHAAEQNIEPPRSPLVFSKCVTALVGQGDAIRLPRVSEMVDYEAELAVVIGREARSVNSESALHYVAGYTIINDVTARDLQRRERQWVRAKGLDTFAPCGPWLVTADEIPHPHSLGIELRVNGELRQSSSTADLIFGVPQLLEFISQDLTLRPGDIISTGTPGGVGVYRQPPVFLKHGDRREITIERIGRLHNPVRGR
jgi:2-keto-4-pentenoate hydratase/2-oxohepta-3-ene-1,7-dioic acid hydratase in catechol pathway